MHNNGRRHKTKGLEKWLKRVSGRLLLLMKRHLTLVTLIHGHCRLYAWSWRLLPFSALVSHCMHILRFLHIFPHTPQYNPLPCIWLGNHFNTNSNTNPAKTLWNHTLKPSESNNLNLQHYLSNICNYNNSKMHGKTHHLSGPMLKTIKTKTRKKWHRTSIP